MMRNRDILPATGKVNVYHTGSCGVASNDFYHLLRRLPSLNRHPRNLASKIIVDEVESEDHQIAIAEVMQVADDAQVGDTVVLDVTPEKEDFGRMAAATTKQVLAQKLRDQQRRMIQEEFADLEDPVLTARVIPVSYTHLTLPTICSV